MADSGAEQLLQAWERSLERPPTTRALNLLAVAAPHLSAQERAELPVGVRDLELLRLRAALFGDTVDAVGECPRCAERLDVGFSLAALIEGHQPEAVPAGVSGSPPTREFELNGRTLTVRPPTSADLLAVAGEPDVDAARSELVRRCLVEPREPVEPPQSVDLAEADLVAISEQLSALDPAARVELDLTCNECGHDWRSVFDITAFLWAEVHAWAQRTLRDVHTLAAAYGWREADILGLTPLRRQAYLDLVGS